MKPVKLYNELFVRLYEGEAKVKRGAPVPILTQWKIVGNSEVHTLPYPDGVVLPTGYKRCEYLESDGTAYIEVPFGFDKTDEIYAKVAMLDITHADKYFVAPKIWNDNTNRFGLGVHNIQIEGSYENVFLMVYGNQGSGGGYLSPVILSDTEVREWEYENYICSMGGSTKDNSNISFGSETANLRLFYGYNTPTECKIFEYRHKKANAEYRLIPCLDSNDTPCMYDVINNQAYYNSAESGSFTYKLYPQPTEIWSCGEYNPIDGKWHILVQPQGGSIADIALTEPLRMNNDVADKIEFANGTATVTRNIQSRKWNTLTITYQTFNNYDRLYTNALSGILLPTSMDEGTKICLSADFAQNIAPTQANAQSNPTDQCMCVFSNGQIFIRDTSVSNASDFVTKYGEKEFLYILATATTETIQVPQIAEADSYTCEISQGAKAVEWSSFSTD